jgi:carboxylate-amine ligase
VGTLADRRAAGVHGSLAAYEETAASLGATGAALDRAMLCLPQVDDAVLVAALTRGLVDTAAAAAQRGEPAPPVRPELVRGAHRRAARYGLAADLVDLRHYRLVSAEHLLGDLVEHVRPALEVNGDLAETSEQVDRVLREGPGAGRQRAAFQRRGCIDDAIDTVLTATVP